MEKPDEEKRYAAPEDTDENGTVLTPDEKADRDERREDEGWREQP